MKENKWHNIALLLVKLLIAAGTGTLTLLAMADDPWDGDELIKGPFTGIVAYGGGDLKNIYQMIRGA